MPKLSWVKVVEWLFKSFGQAADLSLVSTTWSKYLTSQVFSAGELWTGFNHFVGWFTQPILNIFNLFRVDFCTVSTRPMNKTNLIKDY